MILIISKLPLDMVNVKHEQGSTVLVEVNESLFILSVLALYFEEKKKMILLKCLENPHAVIGKHSYVCAHVPSWDPCNL